MTPLDLGSWAAGALTGSMAGAIPVAVFAGLLSFFSPCVLPLIPGYLSYVTGLGAADVIEGQRRARTVVGTVLFVVGFTVVFVATGTIIGTLGKVLVGHRRAIELIVGALTVILGAMFAGFVPLGRRELRIHRLPPSRVGRRTDFRNRLRVGLDPMHWAGAVGGLWAVLDPGISGPRCGTGHLLLVGFGNSVYCGCCCCGVDGSHD